MDAQHNTGNAIALPAMTMTVAIEPDTPAEFADHPWVKARPLARALSDVLAELAADNDRWRAHVEPAGDKYPVMFEALDWQEPIEKQEYELKRFLRASEAVDTNRGNWSVTRCVDTGAVLTVQREPLPDYAAIRTLYLEWLAIQDRSHDLAKADDDVFHARYVALQEQITAMTPLSAADLAIQIVVGTDQGGSDWRDEFYARVAKIAEQAVA